ncbi:FAD-binding oxidoreductase [Natronospora cellulosivora (SeqCode)]
MRQEIIDKLIKITDQDWVDIDSERVMTYSKDSTSNAYGMVAPEPVEGSVIVKPANAEEVSAILKVANEEAIPVVARGGATAISANGIVTEAAIILSLERMNKILEIDEENLMIKCEAAVTLGDLIETLKENDNLYFPLHPGDEGAHVAGMVSMNAGGVRAVRHGIMRNQVQGMEVVLPTGEIVMLGGKEGKLIKNNAGYDLMQLLIGSEGTLGIITKVVLKLYPEPKASGTLIVSYDDRHDAFKTVAKILQAGIIPMAIEYVEKREIELAAEGIAKEWPAKNGKYFLMIILSEDSEDDLFEKGGVIDEICTEYNAQDILIAQTLAEQKDILDIRSHILPAIKDGLVDSPDVTVPRGSLVDYLEILERLEDKYDTKIPVIAHAGDGNLHTVLMKDNGEIPSYNNELKKEIYTKAIEIGGTITGEHGVGALRVDYLPLMYSDRELDIMWQIKKAFDPNNILNPGKSVLKR